MKIANSDRCTFCDVENECLQHLFWSCDIVQHFWKPFQDLINNKCENVINMQFTEEIVLFGNAKNFESDDVIDFLILFAKFYIYKCRLDKCCPQLNMFLLQLKAKFNIEKYVAYMNMSYELFHRKWFCYLPLLKDGT